MAKLSGLDINFEEEKKEDEHDGETAAASPVYFPTYSHRCSAYNPYFPFSDSDSDPGSGSFSDSVRDPNRPYVDFFDRQSREFGTVEDFDSGPGASDAGNFNLWSFGDAEEEEEEEVVFGLGIRSGSDQLWSVSDGGGLRVTGIDLASDYGDGVFDLNFSGRIEDEEEEELGLGLDIRSGSNQPRGESDGGGLRVTRVDSESDSGEGVLDVFDLNFSGRIEDGSGRMEDESGESTIWDSFFGEENVAANEELEWEEVQNSINTSTLTAFDRLEEEELSTASRISSADDHGHDLDWEVLLAVNNVVNYIEQAEGIDINNDDNTGFERDYYLYLAGSDDYVVNYGDYDTIFGQILENESGIRGSPPAAKRVVEDLPLVEFSVEELSKGNIVCAVCKEEITVEEKVRRLPCRHHYHGECIVPWLGIRNTCPVCRYELPTDDLEYERNMRQRSDRGLARESPVRYDSEFEMFA